MLPSAGGTGCCDSDNYFTPEIIRSRKIYFRKGEGSHAMNVLVAGKTTSTHIDTHCALFHYFQIGSHRYRFFVEPKDCFGKIGTESPQ